MPIEYADEFLGAVTAGDMLCRRFIPQYAQVQEQAATRVSEELGFSHTLQQRQVLETLAQIRKEAEQAQHVSYIGLLEQRVPPHEDSNSYALPEAAGLAVVLGYILVRRHVPSMKERYVTVRQQFQAQTKETIDKVRRYIQHHDKPQQ